MNLSINRTQKELDGVFGEIPELDLKTLEHAYTDGGGALYTKIPEGRYPCVRGEHTLPTGEKIETFEVTQVPGHTGILFHPGNKNQDSMGCVLLGLGQITIGGEKWITSSRVAFSKLMTAQKGCDSFLLTVRDPVTHTDL